MFKSKKGVSLITVLLFMLVATIAATATFKWLTSENRSSASRMLRQESYQSAVAGIENTRAWMSYHANEVGAIIKQYYDNQKRPILLNSVLSQLNRANQNYDIWLTGVNTEKNTYKLKLLSKGHSRNGTVHTEAAIIKVDGLYRIKVPQNSERFTFNKAFHGASDGITGNDTIGSGNINGDWAYSNTPVVKGDMLVTGNAEYGGTVHHYGDFYLAGNLVNKAGETIYGTEGLDTTIVYIGGNVTCPEGQPITVHGDLYVKGDVSVKCKVDVKGNFTLGGHITRENDFYVNVGKNWVFTNQNSAPEEQLELKKYVNNNTNFSVGKSLYLPYKIKAHCSDENNCGDSEGKRGFNVGGKVYQYTSSPFAIETQVNQYHFEKGLMKYGVYMDGYTRPFAYRSFCNDDATNCKRGRIFSFNAQSVSSDRIQEWKESDDVLKNITDNYWKNINQSNKYGKMIDPTTKIVPDPIQLKNESGWKAAKANAFCGIGNQFYIDNNLVDKLNMCYINAKAQGKLYNDEYLVIEWQYQEDKYTDKDLVGKFVFDVTTDLGNANLPSTANGSIVFLYLEKGATGQLKGRSGATYNYLVYSKDDINEINGFHFKGSVVMANGKKLKKYQGKNNLEFDAAVLKSLGDAGIIKENPAYTKLVTGEETDEEGVIIGGAVVYDDYYIATSPQLGITLESQYETREEVQTSGDKAAQPIAPSVVILPRVIYLTRNPAGKLTDYYNIINLNGANEQKDASRVTCDPALNTSGALYQNNNMLSDDVYTCSQQSNNYGDLPFYVVVTGETGTTPAIRMADDIVEITTSSQVTISAEVEQTAHAEDVSIDISVSNPPEGWTVTPVTGTSLTLRESSDIEKVYTLTFKPNVSTIDLFTVTTTASAPKGSVFIYLRSPMIGCTIKPPSSTQVLMTGYVSVERASISEYCEKSENSQTCSEKGYDAKADALDCDGFVSGEWIRASGTNVTVTELNNKWSAGTNTAISLKSMHNIPEYCELLLPTENNSILQAQQNGEYTLYASLKRKRYTLVVNTKDATDGDTKVSVYYGESKDSYTDGTTSICDKDSDGNLVCNVYAGWYVKTTYTEAGEDNFSRWECTGDNCPVPSTTSAQFELKPITSNNVINAVFNDKDKHCFYEDFTELTAFCTGTKTHCINTCEGGSNASCTVSGISADWQLMYPNNGNNASIPPVIQNGYITSNNGIQSGNSTIILSTKEAGIHGTMTTMIQTTVLENQTKSLNSGFIFSSDATASSFTILNIYGDASRNKALTARVCEGSNSSNTVSHSNCANVLFKDANSQTVSINTSDMIKLEIELTISNKLTIKATVNNATSTAELDISSYLKSRDEHSRYVGFNVSDPSFKMYDIGWSSLYFAEECFENPKINCSFAANYLGGRVPKDRSVTPWVGLSSWFEDHNCSLTYYYNGCDNETGNASSGCSGHTLGPSWFNYFITEYGRDGTFYGATLNGSTYQFSEEGLHGTSYTSSYGRTFPIKDAKVKISCTDQTSLSGSWTSCGSFRVGEIDHCAQNAEILSSNATAIYGNAGTELDIPVGDNDEIINLRNATLWIDISGFTENSNDKIILYLKDNSGNLSIPREIVTNGQQSFDVDVMSNIDEFDPENVSSIILKSTLYPYQVNTILSSCPYALNILNCKASYNGISWKLTSTITNIEGAAVNGCSVTGIESMTDISCPENGVFAFNEEGLYDDVNNKGISQTRTFEITAKSTDGGIVSCTTDPVTIEPINVECSVASENAVAGQGMPAMTFSFTGCTTSSCDYILSIENTETVTGSGSGESTSWTPNSNKAKALTVGESYTYFATVSGVKKNCGTVKIEKASEAQISNCQITNGTEADSKFTADVTPAPDGSEWSIEVVLTYGGVVITDYPSTQKKGTGYTYESKVHPMKHLAAGTYYAHFRLNGSEVSTCDPIPITKDLPSSSSTTPTSSAAPEESSSSAQSNNGIKCAFSANPVSTEGQAVYFKVTSPSSFSEDNKYIITGPNNFSAEQDVKAYEAISIWMSQNNKVPPAGTYTLKNRNGNELCSVYLETTDKNIQDCEISQTNVLTGSKISFSAKYNGGRCYNASIDVPNGSQTSTPCTLDGIMSEEFYASNKAGTFDYTMNVNGDPQASCSIKVTTAGSTIKQLNYHEYWNETVNCNDSLYISVENGSRTLTCKSNNSSAFSLYGDGIGSANSYYDNGNYKANLTICSSGDSKCERVIRTSTCNGTLGCWVN